MTVVRVVRVVGVADIDLRHVTRNDSR